MGAVQAGSGARVVINNKGQTVSEINTSINRNTINKIKFLCYLAILRTFKELSDNTYINFKRKEY